LSEASVQINFLYDSSVLNAPAGFKQGLTIAANIIDAMILNPITVNIQVGFGEAHGSALPGNALGEAQPAFGVLLSYGELVADLTGAATSADDTAVLSSLPATDPSNGAGFFVSAAQAMAWGVIKGSATEIDGFAGFSSTLPFTYDPANGIASLTYDFVAVALHELTHALGRAISPPRLTPLDLLSYGSNGKLDTNHADARYVSLDGGKTNLVSLDASSDPSDLSSSVPLDTFTAAIAIGRLLSWSALDSRLMDILGYRTASSTPVQAPAAPTPAAEVILHGSHDQYVVVSSNGSLYLDDTVAGRDGTRTLPSGRVMAFTDGAGVFDPSGTAEDVARLYHAALHRSPDLAGLEAWTAAIDTSHVPLSAVANSFAISPEFIQNYGSLSNADFVARLYLDALGRTEDAAGAQQWDKMLASGMSRGEVTVSFAESQEEKADTVATAGDAGNAEVYRLYQTTFNRPADLAGETFWSSALAGGVTLSQIAQDFVGSAEFQQIYGALTTGDFVATLYRNALHRPADATGLQAWTNALRQGVGQANVIAGFSDSLESRVQTAGATHANWVFIPA
jgi:hypothetical protein